MRLLVVEDERRMLELLRRGLTEEGHSVVCASDGSEGLRKVRESEFDVVILDVMMPKLNGYEMARRMRIENNSTPVLMLTARDAVPDVVHGLDVGADDYVTKPFSFHELLLRLGAVRRRAEVAGNSKAQVGDLLLDRRTREVVRNGERISLTRTEYCLLERLMRDAGKVVRRESLIESIWGSGQPVTDNSLDAFVRLLRNKVEGNGYQKLIHTVRGVGYVMRQEYQG
ncbi:MAG TPA: response regulator transcription factor [Terriglobales bacterium]|nr:response regulator transcription factor [Terriglobales bacterium]